MVGKNGKHIDDFVEASQKALHAIDPFVVAQYWFKILPTCPDQFRLWVGGRDSLGRPLPSSAQAVADARRCDQKRDRIARLGIFGILEELSLLTLVLAVLSFGGFVIWALSAGPDTRNLIRAPPFVVIGGTATLFAAKYILYTLVAVFGGVIGGMLALNGLFGSAFALFVTVRHTYHPVHGALHALKDAKDTLRS